MIGGQFVPPFLDNRKFRAKLRTAESVIRAHGIRDIDENRALEFRATAKRMPLVKRLGDKSKAMKRKLKRHRKKFGSG